MFSRRMLVLVFAAAAAAFGWGLIQLLMMRFETGSMFPPYSSYRNDPLGTKALYVSLNRLPGVNAVRYVDPLQSRLEGPADKTVLLIGANTAQPHVAPRSVVEDLDKVLDAGGRVVLAFNPSSTDFEREEMIARVRSGRGQKGDEEENPRDERLAAMAEPTVSLKEHWGIDLKNEPLRHDGDGNIIVQDASLATDDALPETLEWHNGLQFDAERDTWRAVYRCRGETVLAERTVGEGTLVFVGDSYYLSNEGLAANRQSEFITWLLGGNSYVEFDETIVGMQRNPGAAALMRRYNLESLVVGFVVLAVLFAWRAGSSLAPRYSDTLPSRAGSTEAGRDAHAGFANLVQRSTPKGDVVRACVEQWRQNVLPGLARSDAKEIAEALKQTATDQQSAPPVEAYRAVLEQLRERNVHIAYDRKS